MKIERRVINIKKSDYELIKAYCDANALKISEWVVLEIKKIIVKLNKQE